MNKVKANVLLVGDTATGKSTLLHSYLSNGQTYHKDYNMTQGVEIHSKLILGENNDKDVEFYFFDAGGHPIFKPIVEGIYQNINYVILVYDATSKGSFEYVQAAYDELKKAAGKSIPGVLVAAKSDLKTLKVVDYGTGAELASQLNLNFVELSTLKNSDVEKPFQALKDLVLKR